MDNVQQKITCPFYFLSFFLCSLIWDIVLLHAIYNGTCVNWDVATGDDLARNIDYCSVAGLEEYFA